MNEITLFTLSSIALIPDDFHEYKRIVGLGVEELWNIHNGNKTTGMNPSDEAREYTLNGILFSEIFLSCFVGFVIS